jgi:hypothetical protein
LFYAVVDSEYVVCGDCSLKKVGKCEIYADLKRKLGTRSRLQLGMKVVLNEETYQLQAKVMWAKFD